MNNQAKKDNTYPLFDQQEDAISAYMGSLLGVVPEKKQQASNSSVAKVEPKKSVQDEINIIKNQIINQVTSNNDHIVSNTNKASSKKNKVIPIQVTDENGESTIKFIEPRIKSSILPETTLNLEDATSSEDTMPSDDAISSKDTISSEEALLSESTMSVQESKVDEQNETPTIQEKLSDESLSLQDSKSNYIAKSRSTQVLEKLETNKIRYRNLKHFLSQDASSDEIEAVSRKKVNVENSQLKKDLFTQKKINDELNLKVEQLSSEVKTLKALEYNQLQIDNNIPAWAVPSFQVMSLRLKQLKVAIPMHLLQSVLSVEVENLHHYQTKKGNKLLIGEIEFENQKITLLDLKSVIFPTNKVASIQEREFSIIVIKDELTEALFGLLCDDISGVETYNFQSFAWKTSSTSRKWLAATNRKDKSVVIDTRGLFHTINSIE